MDNFNTYQPLLTLISSNIQLTLIVIATITIFFALTIPMLYIRTYLACGLCNGNVPNASAVIMFIPGAMFLCYFKEDYPKLYLAMFNLFLLGVTLFLFLLRSSLGLTPILISLALYILTYFILGVLSELKLLNLMGLSPSLILLAIFFYPAYIFYTYFKLNHIVGNGTEEEEATS